MAAESATGINHSINYFVREGVDGFSMTRTRGGAPRPTLPPLESEIRDAKMSNQWKSGKCRRGHDVTDENNVRYSVDWCRGHWVRKRTCEECNRDRKRLGPLPPGIPVDVFGPRVCEICDEKFYRTDSGISYQSWTQRKYCSRKCVNKAKRMQERTRPLPKPLSDKQCASLRRMVGYDPNKDYASDE